MSVGEVIVGDWTVFETSVSGPVEIDGWVLHDDGCVVVARLISGSERRSQIRSAFRFCILFPRRRVSNYFYILQHIKSGCCRQFIPSQPSVNHPSSHVEGAETPNGGLHEVIGETWPDGPSCQYATHHPFLPQPLLLNTFHSIK